MNAKQWLGRARAIAREIDAYKMAKQEARDQLTRITQSYESDGAQSSKDPHKYDRLVEFDNLIDQKLNELTATRIEITEAISQLEDGRHRTVLLDYYVRLMTLEQIAVEINYSYRQVKRYRAAALQRFEARNAWRWQ